MRNININQATEDCILALPVVDEYNRILLNTDVVLNNRMIQKLKEKGIDTITIEDDISFNIDISDNISQKLKRKTIKHLKDLNLDKAMVDASKIVDELMSTSELYEYLNIKTFDNYTFEHSVSVATYATMMGIACYFTKEECRDLALAGMLHDIGKRSIDDSIINKPGKLTPEEFEEIKKHPKIGYNLVKDSFSIPATVKVAIYEHHENEDGSGYPRQLKSKDIYKFAKIIHIVDVYDALISNRSYKEAINPKKAIDYIIKNSGILFSKEYVDVFIQIMPVYSKGSIVELSDGRKSIVLKNHKGNIYRPDIRILNTKEIINLSKDTSIEIIRKIELELKNEIKFR